MHWNTDELQQDGVWWNGYFLNINYANLWTWEVFSSPGISLSFSFQYIKCSLYESYTFLNIFQDIFETIRNGITFLISFLVYFHLYLWSCWPLGFFWTPPIIQAIANALDYLPEFDGKALLLKTLHTWVTEPKELKIVVFQKLHSSLLIFIVMLGEMYTTRQKLLLLANFHSDGRCYVHYQRK